LVLAVLLVLAALPARSAHAGAWGKDPWKFYLQLGTAFTTTGAADNKRFDAAGNEQVIQVRRNNATAPLGNSNYQQLMTDFYFELGVVKRLTIFGNLPFASARQRNEGGDISYSANGIGDLMLGARVALVENPLAVALEVRLGFPTGDPLKIIPLGTGDFRGELRLAIGKAWSDLVVPIYFDIEFGFMLRGGATVRDSLNFPDGTKIANYAPELAFHTEVGLTILKTKKIDRLLLIAIADYRGSTRREAAIGNLNFTPETSEMTAIGGSLMGFIWRGLGVSLRYTHVVQGRSIPVTGTVAGAVFASF